jgi:hypothetical protein
VLAASGTRPRRTKTNPKREHSPAKRMSHCSGSVAPTPAAVPLSAPMIGFGISHARSGRRTSPASANTVAPPSKSAPTQKSAPAPVTTIARTASLAAAAASASRYSSPMRRVQALRRSGRASVIVATRSATS